MRKIKVNLGDLLPLLPLRLDYMSETYPDLSQINIRERQHGRWAEAADGHMYLGFRLEPPSDAAQTAVLEVSKGHYPDTEKLLKGAKEEQAKDKPASLIIDPGFLCTLLQSITAYLGEGCLGVTVTLLKNYLVMTHGDDMVAMLCKRTEE